jgi:hypothetical protein
MFDLFVEKHKDTILSVDVATHPPDHENIRKWIEKHTDELDIPVAKIISTSITNVSYDDIISKFNDLSNDVLTLYEQKESLFLYVPIETRKSNFFFTVLFYYACKCKGVRFTDIVSVKSQYFNTTGDPNIIIMVDDASYSGNQICNTIITEDILYNHNIFLAIPYISTSARRMIEEKIEIHTEVIISMSSDIFKNIKEIVNEYDKQLSLDIKIYDRYMYQLTAQHLLYLDFKLPDSISIPQTIFAYGYKLSDPDVKVYKTGGEVLSFISGCSEVYRHNLHIAKRELDVNDETDEVCPITFYKNSAWEF